MILKTVIWLIYLKFVLNLPRLQLHNPPIPNSTNFSFPSVSISTVFKWAVSHNLGKLLNYLMINIETNYQRGHCLDRQNWGEIETDCCGFMVLNVYVTCYLAVSLLFHWEGKQCCQLSQIIWETPDFGPYLPVSRLEHEIAQIFTEVCHSVVDSNFWP